MNRATGFTNNAGATTIMKLWHEPAGRVGLALVTLVLAVAVFGPMLVSHPPNDSFFASGKDPLGLPVGPCSQHWLGTDTLFRDLLSRLVHGARLSLSIAVSSSAIALSLGVVAGIIASLCYQTRLHLIDAAIMRLVDAALAVPYLLFVMAIGSLLDSVQAVPDTLALVVILGTTGWLGTCRLVRAKTIQLQRRDFVLAAKGLGQSTVGVIAKHLLPNMAGPILVTASSSMASMILAESVLSYLNVGVRPPQATWGRMLREGQSFLTADPRLVAVPAIAILVTVVGFHLIGEGVRDAVDPYSQPRG